MVAPSDTVFEFAWRNRFANVAIIGYKLFWRYLAIANYGSYRVMTNAQLHELLLNSGLIGIKTKNSSQKVLLWICKYSY